MKIWINVTTMKPTTVCPCPVYLVELELWSAMSQGNVFAYLDGGFNNQETQLPAINVKRDMKQLLMEETVSDVTLEVVVHALMVRSELKGTLMELLLQGNL